MPVIEIKTDHGYFHARDVIARSGENLEAVNAIPGTTFIVNIKNKERIIAGNDFISVLVPYGASVPIGTVNAGGEVTKEYDIFPDLACPFPGIDAPPRIIRVV